MALNKLDAALAWAERGFRVFPLQPMLKKPLFTGWTETATTDAEAIRATWTDPVLGWTHDYNVGVLTDDMIVLDVDAHKDGYASLLDLDVPLDTLTVKTPRGGVHLYFKGPNRDLSVDKLGRGLDIRSYHGYVIAPGSETAEGSYTLENDVDVQDVPQAILTKLDQIAERKSSTPVTDLDTASALLFARRYLADGPSAVEGQGGDTGTYKVACAVKDCGISERKCFELMRDHWNERCSPPWPWDELERKVANAYEYGRDAIGAAAPEVVFAGVVPLEAPEIDVFAAAQRASALIEFRPFTLPHAMPRRAWIIPRVLMRGVVTVLAAPGSAGKSTLQLAIAAHLAVGKSFGDMRIEVPVRSLVANIEDDRLEMERRILAVCLTYELDPVAVAANVAFLPGAEFCFKVADGDRPIKLRTEELEQFAKRLKELKIGVMMVDPFIETHDSDDSDNQAMRQVMAAYRDLAQKSDTAMFVTHHTPKGASAGAADALRGATAIANSARIALTLFDASEDDAETYGIPAHELNRYVRLDDAKMNMSLRGAAPMWFKRHGVVLPNGDEVGVLRLASVKAAAAAEALSIAKTLHAAMLAQHRTSASTYEAAKLLAAEDPVWGQRADEKSMRTVQRRIEKALRQGLELEDGSMIKLEANSEGGAVRYHVVIE